MRFSMKGLTLFSLGAGLACSATLGVRFEGEIDEIIWGPDHEPPSRDWTHFRFTFEIDEFPTPIGCYPGCHEEGMTPEFDRYTTIPVTATLQHTGGWKGEKKETTGAAYVTYFVDHGGRSGLELAFMGRRDRYIMPFLPSEPGYEPPEASPKILAMETRGSDVGWIGYVGFPTEPFFEGYYKATLIPEPGTMATLGAGIAGLALIRRRLGRSR